MSLSENLRKLLKVHKFFSLLLFRNFKHKSSESHLIQELVAGVKIKGTNYFYSSASLLLVS